MKALNAQEIKGILIDHLIAKSTPDIIIASEVPFVSRKRWADLLLIHKNRLHAFEIKSSLDSFDKLRAQTKDYLNTFDYTTLVTSVAQADKAKQHITDHVGIVHVDDLTTKITKKRTPIMRKRKLKENLLNFLWRDDLLKALRKKRSVSERGIETFYIREQVGDLYSVEEIHDMAVIALIERYGIRYKNFLRERGDRTIVEDLPFLTTKQSSLLF